jgi:hypothetical protein
MVSRRETGAKGSQVIAVPEVKILSVEIRMALKGYTGISSQGQGETHQI